MALALDLPGILILAFSSYSESSFRLPASRGAPSPSSSRNFREWRSLLLRLAFMLLPLSKGQLRRSPGLAQIHLDALVTYHLLLYPPQLQRFSDRQVDSVASVHLLGGQGTRRLQIKADETKFKWENETYFREKAMGKEMG